MRLYLLYAAGIPAPLASAQPGLDEFYQVTGEIHRVYFSFSDLILVIGAISGLCGGLRVYGNWQSGKRYIDVQVMAWFFSCLFLTLLSVTLKALFGLP